MPFEQVESLKKQYTDKYVEVDGTVSELRRFKGLTGVVKTVNMSGRALVQFDHPVDISWYDIDPTYLQVVEKPIKSAEPSKHAAEGEKQPAAAAKAVPAAKPAAAGKPRGMSPLEMARAQGAAGSGKGGTTPAAAAPSAPPAGGKPLSKLEQARQQGAAGSAKAAAAPPASATPGPGGKPLSKIELARMQGAAGSAKTAPPA